HLEREPAADPGFAANELRIGHEPLIERERERVHAAIARRAIRFAGQRAAAVLLRLEGMAVEARFVDDKQRQTTRALAHVRIGAREQRDDVGATCERAPGLRTGNVPAALRTLG